MKKGRLRIVNLDLKDGDFATIVGSNGAGKSTMFNAITGAFYVDEGQIILDGEDITYKKEYLRSHEIGHLFQDPLRGTAPGMTIRGKYGTCLSACKDDAQSVFQPH